MDCYNLFWFILSGNLRDLILNSKNRSNDNLKIFKFKSYMFLNTFVFNICFFVKQLKN